MSEAAVQLVADAVPDQYIQRLLEESRQLEAAPNYWVPLHELSSPKTTAEEVVAELYAACIKNKAIPGIVGAEYWLQIYEQGRGLGFHMDKDEHVMATEGKMVNPLLSSVLYLTGSTESAERQAPTVITDQAFDHECGEVVPESPTLSTLCFPIAGHYCIFDGRLGHGVLDSGEGASLRATLLVNWWQHKPQAVDRTPGGCRPERPFQPAQAQPPTATGAPRRLDVPVVAVPASKLDGPDGLLPVDFVLEDAGIKLAGPGSVDGVTLRHPGLVLSAMETEGTPFVVGALLGLPYDDEGSDSETSNA